MSEYLGWTPQPRQYAMLTCPAEELLFGGAAGGGKSDALLGDALTRAEQYGAGFRGVLFRRSYPELEEIITRALEIFSGIGSYHTTSKTWTFRGGGTLKLRYIESDADVYSYQGHQYSWIAFDELGTYATSFAWEYLKSRLRSATGTPCVMRATANPGGPGHAWLRARWINDKVPNRIYFNEKGKYTSAFIPSKLEDNTALMANDPGYAARLDALPENLRRALRDGDWDVFAGQVFSEWRYDRHVVKPFPLNVGWHKYASMDWGYARPFSIGWWAVNGDGRCVRYREWYGCDPGEDNKGLKLAASEVAAKSFEISSAEGVDTMIADPACWSKIDDSPSIADKFAGPPGARLWTMQKADNDRVNGLARLHDLMMTDGEDGKPMLLVFSTCAGFIRTIPALVADPKKPEDVDTKMEDHCFVEGTLVSTRQGDIPIETIKAGMEVMTRQGYRKVLDVWDEGIRSTVIGFFDNATTLQMTSGHKVWTQDGGFTRADVLRYGAPVLFKEATWRPRQLFSMESRFGGIPSLLARLIAAISNHLRVTAGGGSRRFIGRSGKRFMVLSPQGLISTMSTRTRGIIPLRTSSASKGGGTSPSTSRTQDGSAIGPEEGRELPPGTHHPKEALGTRLTSRQPGIRALSGSIAALIVGLLSRAEASGNPSTARGNARPVRFVRLIPGTTQRVLNLSVEGVHEFFANGILVANCYDESRYGVMSDLARDPRRIRHRNRMPAATERGDAPYDPLRAGMSQ